MMGMDGLHMGKPSIFHMCLMSLYVQCNKIFFVHMRGGFMKAGRAYIVILSILCVLCGCGNQVKETENSQVSESVTQPTLNENGREEIYLSTIFLNVTMQEIVSDYNRQSDRYEIVPLEFDRESTAEDQRTRIQLELTGGGGPDILADTALRNGDMRPYAQAGVLLDVTDFLAEQGGFVKNVVEANEVEDRIYGIPYSFSLQTMVTSPAMATERESWTPEYCMRAAQDAGVTAFVEAPYGWTSEQSGLYVLNVLGVGISGIQLYVDEEQGISSFEQPEFIALLEFAKKYSDPETRASRKGKYASGEIFCVTTEIGNFDSFRYCDELFDGEPVYMGYPSPQGARNMIRADSLYINAASPHVEGALDFIEYLLEEEQQRKTVLGVGNFPVKQELLKSMWTEVKEETSGGLAYEIDDIRFDARPMTDEEEQVFWEMLESPLYDQWQNDIWDIVEEEAQPFFCGDKPAGEVARAIDNRVQLYLDERKK